MRGNIPLLRDWPSVRRPGCRIASSSSRHAGSVIRINITISLTGTLLRAGRGSRLLSEGTPRASIAATSAPIGVHIRPFSASSWYASDFAHAHRITAAIPSVQTGETREAEEGGALDP